MTSPEFTAICCLKGTGRSDSSGEDEVVTSSIFNGICLASSSVSLVGTMFVLLSRRHNRQTMLVPGLKLYPVNETIQWLALADILMVIGFFTRSIIWISGYTPYPLFSAVTLRHKLCVGITVWIEFHCISSYMWNFTYALDILLATHSKPRLKALWPFFNLVIPAVLTASGSFSIYYPSLSTCGGPNVNEVANYLAYFLPMLLVIVCNPFFFYYTAKKVKSLVTQQHGRYSVREQVIVQSAKVKFTMIIFVFIACWFPNVVNAILDAVPINESVQNAMWAMWVLKAIMNPLQALLNSVVFRGWPRHYCNCLSQQQHHHQQPQYQATKYGGSSSSNIHINSALTPSNETFETDLLLT
ncbi:G-protein coupled receptor 143-like isoform X1 [Octopus vulgaris]|uniref:G-protein coupled receptor 143-like isoform X1 n=1 Tax=Octopus vulgaris TaxID=6645 RepID=A0AA36C1Q7_OCTVU|nr:G-protein coupled receptor 143-like isoform X1 [Octopus vulgaris]